MLNPVVVIEDLKKSNIKTDRLFVDGNKDKGQLYFIVRKNGEKMILKYTEDIHTRYSSDNFKDITNDVQKQVNSYKNQYTEIDVNNLSKEQIEKKLLVIMS